MKRVCYEMISRLQTDTGHIEIAISAEAQDLEKAIDKRLNEVEQMACLGFHAIILKTILVR
jgi:hypothetical protein